MTPVVTFIVPVRHPANSTDWGGLTKRLAETARSIAAQTSPAWEAIIVANDGSELPELPAKFSVECVSFPPNPFYDKASHEIELVYDSFRLDKGRRVLAGMLAAGRTEYFMIVDDDDFVSRDIVEFVSKNSGANGWEVRSGWLWSEGGTVLMQHNQFHDVCGTSLIIRADLYELPDKFADASDEFVKAMLGSHRKISGILAARGAPLAALPFRGAIYRVGHSGAHSKSSGLIRSYLFNLQLMVRPWVFARNLTKFRWIDGVKRQSFFAL